MNNKNSFVAPILLGLASIIIEAQNFRMKHTFYLLIILFTTISCNDEVRKNLTPKPTALGRLNDVVVIADDELWEGESGEHFRFFYESAYPIMPTPEPLFDLRHFSGEQIAAEPLRRELRTYVIIADLSKRDSKVTKMVRRDLGEERFNKAVSDTSFFSTAGMDKWAREQFVGYVFGNGRDDLHRAIEKSFGPIANRIKIHDSKQLSSNVFNLQNEDPKLKELLKEEFHLDIRIPDDYKQKIDLENNFIMLKKDFRDFSQSIVIRKFEYKNESQFTKENIVSMRNEYGEAFITGETEGSFMISNDRDLPIYEYTYELGGSYVKEIRGVWELINDFVGGPFATYVLLNKSTNELIFIDTFVYAPSKTKRDLMQQLEYIAKTAKAVPKSVAE